KRFVHELLAPDEVRYSALVPNLLCMPVLQNRKTYKGVATTAGCSVGKVCNDPRRLSGTDSSGCGGQKYDIHSHRQLFGLHVWVPVIVYRRWLQCNSLCKMSGSVDGAFWDSFDRRL
ncbi:Hypothetical predicted protein, partial [Paramuricea clavata]